jgi:membrane associated rhomboid family serine protease
MARQSSSNQQWWQGGNDDDLKRNPYAEETEYRYGHNESTASSMCIEQDLEEADYARQSSSRQQSSSSGGFGGRKEFIGGGGGSKPSSAPKAKARIEKGSNNKRTVKWTCGACTFYNVQQFTLTSEPKITMLCEMCSTPSRIRVDGRSSRGEKKASESVEPTNNRRDGRTSSRKPSSGKMSTPRSSSANDGERNKIISKPRMGTRTSSTGENTITTSASSDGSSSNKNASEAIYSMAELIKSLGTDENNAIDLPPALERRVQDFRFAQNKRREKHGDQKPWGIYGLYAHLSDIRADLEWAEDAAWRRHKGKPYLSWRDFDESRDKGLHSRPIFTYALLALCSIMMFVTLAVNNGFEPLTVNPLIGPSSETLVRCGARDSNLIVNESQWFRLFTPIILHAGLVHYVVNMLALYFIGGAVEKAHGIASAAVLFVVPAVGGNILSAICLPGFISVGASGGIFGLIGGCMADICLNWNLLFLKTTTDDDTRSRHFYVLLWLALDIIINCLLGFTPFVDNFTHLGGFLYGFCIAYASLERLASTFFGIRTTKESQWSRLTGMLLRFFGLIVSIIAIMVTTIVLVQSDGVTSPCSGCRYISCVPFPPNAEEKWWYCDDCDVVTADIYQSTDGSGLYEQVDLNCPNGEIEEVPIDREGIYDREELRRLLPKMCRKNCAEVFGVY